MIYDKDPLLGKRQNIYVSKRGLFPLKLNSLIRVLTVLKKTASPACNRPITSERSTCDIIGHNCNSSGMHNLPQTITYLLAQKVIKVLEYSFFSSNRAASK